MNTNKNFHTPILLLTWKSKDSIKKLIYQLRKLNAKKIYIYSDGFKEGPNKISEINKIIKTRNTILDSLDWDCNVKFNFNYYNLGCKLAVIKAIDWFFENEDSGIILEEDCIPNNSFFYFCTENLLKYQNIKKIGSITGVNFQEDQKISNSSYYFSKYNAFFGWATWKRSWEIFDKKMKFWPKMKLQKQWDIDTSMNQQERKYWEERFDNSYNNLIDSWAYPWLASLWFNKKITITPVFNLVSNIGLNGKAIYTKNRFSNYANIKTTDLKQIIHNNNINISIQADRNTFKKNFYENIDPNFISKINKKLILLIKIFINPKKVILYIRDKIK